MTPPDAAPTAVSLREIAQVCEQTLAAMITAVGEDVPVHVDYYWSIPRDQRYDVYQEPSALTIGQVHEDLDNLRRLLAEADPVVLPQALRWLGAVLTAVGDELAP